MSLGAVRCAIAASVGLILTACVAYLPSLSFSYDASDVRVVLETTVTLVGALAALLWVGRYRRSHHPSDGMTAWALALLALSFPLLVAVPTAFANDSGERFGLSASVCARLIAAGLLAVAGWLSSADATRDAGRRWRLMALAPLLAAVTVFPLLVSGAGQGAHAFTLANVGRPQPLAHPLLAFTQLGAAVLFGLAAFEFAQRSRYEQDHFVGWLGVGCALLAVGSVNYALSPTLETAWLHTGDLFRAGAVVAVAIGAVQEIQSYWAGLAELARSQERRALASDLHDGLAQELAYLVSQTQTPDARQAPRAWRNEMQSAAERALAESRRSIRALASDETEPFERNLITVANEAIERAPTRIDLVTDTDSANIAFPVDEQESVLRIAREALTNAVRHSHASQITISVSGPSPRTLRVCDNGIGFDPDEAAETQRGFGLISMRERAESLGASFAVQSTPGTGTTLEIRWQ
jgi:signal transduction histidine kinase